jgi:hypothetical protein
MTSKSITINIELTDQFCSDIMCTALEGGIGYWAQADKIVQSDEEDCMLHYVSCKLAALNDDETDFDWSNPYTLDFNAIRRGVERVLHPDFSVRSDIRGWILADLCDQERGGMIDSEAADVIVQAALFGEIVYG